VSKKQSSNNSYADMLRQSGEEIKEHTNFAYRSPEGLQRHKGDVNVSDGERQQGGGAGSEARRKMCDSEEEAEDEHSPET
jgi:hypothetical protein